MSLRNVILTLTILLCACLPTHASESNDELVKRVRFNDALARLHVDATALLHAAVLLENGDSAKVQAFLDYKLDEIVCMAWKSLPEMNPKQKIATITYLHDIKLYRQEHPRGEAMTIDPEFFSTLAAPYNATYAQRADEILAQVK